jgi:hypothetical protein
MADPELFTIVGAPLGGRIGPETLWEPNEACPACGTAGYGQIAALHFLVDFNDGQPLFSSRHKYAVTPPLQQMMEEERITGIEFRPAIADWSPEILASERKPDEKLPVLSHMAIVDTLEAGPGWATASEPCPNCGRRSWTITAAGIDALTARHGDQGPHRTLTRGSYTGQDAFLMDDFEAPVVTRRYRDLLAHGDVKGMVYQPVDMIDG